MAVLRIGRGGRSVAPRVAVARDIGPGLGKPRTVVLLRTREVEKEGDNGGKECEDSEQRQSEVLGPLGASS